MACGQGCCSSCRAGRADAAVLVPYAAWHLSPVPHDLHVSSRMPAHTSLHTAAAIHEQRTNTRNISLPRPHMHAASLLSLVSPLGPLVGVRCGAAGLVQCQPSESSAPSVLWSACGPLPGCGMPADLMSLMSLLGSPNRVAGCLLASPSASPQRRSHPGMLCSAVGGCPGPSP